jgi:predicted transcriptional regulator
MEKNKVFYSVNFLNSVEEFKGVKLNGFQKTILSLFNNEGIFYLNSNVIKILNTNKKSLVYKLNNLIKMGIIFKVETNVYNLDSNISKKFDKHNGFYIECDLFKNSNLSPYTVILYSFFKVFEKDGFLMNTKTIDKYLGFSKLTLYNSIDSLKENGLIKIEKSKFKNRFKYFALPYTIEGEEQEDEEILDFPTIEEVLETPTTPTIDNEQIERLNDRLDKAGEVVKQQQEIINQQQEQINQLKKSLVTYIEKFNKMDKVFQPLVEYIDEVNSDLESLYCITNNKRAKCESQCDIINLRNILHEL